jgi:hypothetical protein
MGRELSNNSGMAQFLVGEQTVDGEGWCLVLCIKCLCTSFLERRGSAIALILQGTERRGSRVCSFFIGRSLAFSLPFDVCLSNTMAGMTSLAVALKAAWTLWDVDGELTGVEEQSRVVGNVELLFFA